MKHLIWLLASQTAFSAITTEQVAKHNKPDDCWIVIRGHVYNVTSYVRKHPKPEHILTDWCGKPDATEAYEKKGKKNKPHSPRANRHLKTLGVGELAPAK